MKPSPRKSRGQQQGYEWNPLIDVLRSGFAVYRSPDTTAAIQTRSTCILMLLQLDFVDRQGVNSIEPCGISRSATGVLRLHLTHLLAGSAIRSRCCHCLPSASRTSVCCCLRVSWCCYCCYIRLAVRFSSPSLGASLVLHFASLKVASRMPQTERVPPKRCRHSPFKS